MIAFTSQALRQYGIRAVRMDDIARNMSISKRTIYQAYVAKDNLINICLKSYLDRMKELFQIIKYNHPEALEQLWETSKAYIENLYKVERIFWLDVSQYLKYEYIYDSHNCIWSDELEQIILACQKEGYVITDFNTSMFANLFTTLLYNSRVAGCSPTMLHSSAYFMLRGIMTEQGSKLFGIKEPLSFNTLLLTTGRTHTVR